jgi:hypothetical protein
MSILLTLGIDLVIALLYIGVFYLLKRFCDSRYDKQALQSPFKAKEREDQNLTDEELQQNDDSEKNGEI